jgi:hypothetical protein
MGEFYASGMWLAIFLYICIYIVLAGARASHGVTENYGVELSHEEKRPQTQGECFKLLWVKYNCKSGNNCPLTLYIYISVIYKKRNGKL